MKLKTVLIVVAIAGSVFVAILGFIMGVFRGDPHPILTGLAVALVYGLVFALLMLIRWIILEIRWIILGFVKDKTCFQGGKEHEGNSPRKGRAELYLRTGLFAVVLVSCIINSVA